MEVTAELQRRVMREFGVPPHEVRLPPPAWGCARPAGCHSTHSPRLPCV